MRRSKLEACEAILETLLKKPLAPDRMAFETGIDCVSLNRYLDLLVRNGLIDERVSNRKTLYGITERGMMVFKTLNFQKYLQKVSETLRILDEATQAVPVMSKYSQGQNGENRTEKY